MHRNLAFLAFLTLLALPATAQNWSVGVHTGPFVFGDFMNRTLKVGNGEGSSESGTSTLSAATRAGAAIDIEHGFGERWAVRLEGTATSAPLAIKGSSDDGFDIDAGKIDVGTLMLPIVFRINPRGSFRFHVMAGPAYAAYHIRTGTDATPIFTGTRAEWGAALGGGIAWQWSEKWGVEGNFTDVATTSPFRRTDFPPGPGLEIPKTHNIHTTIGLRVRF